MYLNKYANLCITYMSWNCFVSKFCLILKNSLRSTEEIILISWVIEFVFSRPIDFCKEFLYN